MLDKTKIFYLVFLKGLNPIQLCQKLWRLASKNAILILKKRIRSLEPKLKKAFYKRKIKKYAAKLSIFRGKYIRRKSIRKNIW
jgi:hypothetical protein